MEQVTEFSFLGPITTAAAAAAVANVRAVDEIPTHTVQEKNQRYGKGKSSSPSARKLWGFSYIQQAPSQPSSSSSRPQWIGGDEQTGRSGQVVADAGGVFTAGAYRSHLISNEYLTLYRRKKRHHPPLSSTFSITVPHSTSTAVAVRVEQEERSGEPVEASGMEDSDGRRQDLEAETYRRDDDDDDDDGRGDGDFVTRDRIHELSLLQGCSTAVLRYKPPLDMDTTEDPKFHFPSHIRKRRSYFGTTGTGTEEETYLPYTDAPTTSLLTSSDFDEDDDGSGGGIEPNFEHRYHCDSVETAATATTAVCKKTDFNRYFSHMTSAYAYLEPAPYQECRRSVTPTERNNPNPRWFFPL